MSPLKILFINGPNLNLLGLREPEIYGNQTYKQLVSFITSECNRLGIMPKICQHNCEGAIIDAIQSVIVNNFADAIIINPAAYTHTSIAIMDALKAVAKPAVEVHLSDISKREDFRQISYAGLACIKTFAGEGFNSYSNAINFLADYFRKSP